jgi:hypothetical protein
LHKLMRMDVQRAWLGASDPVTSNFINNPGPLVLTSKYLAALQVFHAHHSFVVWMWMSEEKETRKIGEIGDSQNDPKLFILSH